MSSKFKRSWDAYDWQRFALQFAQQRHGAQNVQTVPDTVQGDAGIEFYTLDGCAYQCYAPQLVDTAKAASAMKTKAQRDLAKLHTYDQLLCGILGSVRISRWILLCPFLDDKKVVTSVRTHGAAIKQRSPLVLATDFEALVQSQVDFAGEIEALTRRPILLSISEQTASAPVGSELEQRLVDKLKRAFPVEGPSDQLKRKQSFIAAYTERENLLSDLAVKHPQLWELAMAGIRSEERELELMGARGAQPADMLRASLDRIDDKLGRDLSDVARSTVSALSRGTLGDWLMRCPLDFPEALP